MSQIGVSVVIPVYNGAERVPTVLNALAFQDAADGTFEIIVVDNALTDESGAVARKDAATLRLRDRGVAVRVIAEPRQGTTYARICGVRESKSDLICFLDDDNIPDREYISHGLAAFKDTSIDLAVSRISPRWEIAPSRSIFKRRHLYAVNDYLGNAPIDWGAKGTMVPTLTAGMWVRREAFLKAVPCDRIDLLVGDEWGTSCFVAKTLRLAY
jgi:glycosyltransferase involved in cell wall biosynthesis